MASVQELIDAANAQKSPGISAMEGLARGYLNGQQQALERAKTLILLEQNKREQEQMIESRKRMDAQYAADMEKRRKQEISNAAAKLAGVTPQQKIDDVVTTWERDAKGNLSQKITTAPAKEDDPMATAYKLAQIGALNARVGSVAEGVDMKKAAQLAKNTQTLSKRIDDLGIPEAITQFETIARLIPKSGDVPGFGRAESLVPNVLAGKDARKLRQAVQALQNVKIKDRSGAAVTPQEFVRLEEEFGTGKLKTEEQLRQGLNQAVASYRERVRNTMAGFDEETKAEYMSRDNIQNPLDVLSSFDFSSGGGTFPSGGNGSGSGTKKVNRFQVSVEN